MPRIKERIGNRPKPVFGKRRLEFEPGPVTIQNANRRKLRDFISSNPGKPALWYRLNSNVPGVTMHAIRHILEASKCPV